MILLKEGSLPFRFCVSHTHLLLDHPTNDGWERRRLLSWVKLAEDLHADLGEVDGVDNAGGEDGG